MAESKEAIRERVRRFRELKKKIGVTIVTKTGVTKPPQPDNDFEERLSALEARMRRLENPEEATRQQALKPGSRPNDLYGA